MLDPIPSPSTHNQRPGAEPGLLPRLEEMSAGYESAPEIVEEAASALVARAQRAEQLLEGLLDWVGDIRNSRRSATACTVLREALRHGPPEKTQWIIERLKSAENDAQHERRTADIAYILSSSLRGSPVDLSRCLAEQLASSDDTVCRNAVKMWSGELHRLHDSRDLETARALFFRHVSEVLLLLTRPQTAEPSSFSAVLTAFRGFFARGPEAMLDTVLAITRQEDVPEESQSIDLLRAGITLLDNFESLACPTLPRLLADRLVTSAGDDNLVANVLLHMGDRCLDACFDKIATVTAQGEFHAWMQLLPHFGDAALNGVIGRMEQGGDADLVWGIGCLGSFANHIARGDSDPAQQAQLAAMERTLRSARVAQLITRAAASQNGIVRAQAEEYTRCLGIM